MIPIQATPVLAAAFLLMIANSWADAPQYSESNEVKRILDTRCVVCHGCYDAPCQLKLGAYEGLVRGATPQPVYNPSRFSEDVTTRLFIDSRTLTDWRKLGFHEVITTTSNSPKKINYQDDVFYRLITRKPQKTFSSGKKLPADFPLDINRKLSCVAKTKVDDFLAKQPLAAMPYGMAPLLGQEQQQLENWIKRGYPDFDPPLDLPSGVIAQVDKWEAFFNQASPRHKLVARYLYEHLFLGHLAITEQGKNYYFRLIRSSTPTAYIPNEIATRRPNNDPGRKLFYYRLVPIRETLLDKTHIVYPLDQRRMTRWYSLFFSSDWQVSETAGYTTKNAANPFFTFSAIPSDARYRFMLDNAQFFIESFIKGPVCRGQVALNVINDYFFVAFLSPEYDLSVVDKTYLPNAIPFLYLPPTTAAPLDFAALWHEGLHGHRRYLEYRDNAYRDHVLTRQGLPITAIWKGENLSTPLLTVFRHFDSASVSAGLIGEGPNTVWVIDYPTLERIYYDLVVNFDVFGSVSHQMLTRMYMDYLRMESEGLFLSFLPVADREPILKRWYRGALAQAKVFYGHSKLLIDTPAAIRYAGNDGKSELIEMIRDRSSFKRYKAVAIGDRVPSALKPLDHLSAKQSPWIHNLPELSYVIIHNEDNEIEQVISMIINKAHANVSFIFGEENRRRPEEDTMMLVGRAIGSYPNFLFWVERKKLDKFTSEANNITDPESMARWVERYGVRRTDRRIWWVLDKLHHHRGRMGGGEGLLDVSRYDNL
ncbi:MAG: peptidylprolyl isomerase [Gammaproteobacteria bacterium]|nr:peptidylprolyl isomerase [Gammaproteobacteria bacterium]